MKSWLQFVSKFLLAFLAITLLLPIDGARADVNDFVIHDFSATYYLSRDDPQGKLMIDENIDLTFSDNNHGILRSIPEKYGNDDANPKIISVMRDGASEPYTTYSQNNNLVLQIGNAVKTITGAHVYEIKYSVENVIRFYNDHDELYWDVNGDEWSQPFEATRAMVTIPDNLNFEDSLSPICFSGYYASTDKNCEITKDGDHKLVVSANTELLPSQTLTFIAAFPKGYFTPVPLWQKLIVFIPGLVFLGIVLMVVISAYKKWRKFGKDYPAASVIAPAFGAPKDLDLLGSAYVYEDKIIPKHISACIIDLAIRGYIRIIETDDGGILKKKTKRSLELLKPLSGLTSQEVSILTALFGSAAPGEVIDIDTKKAKLFKEVENLSKSLSDVTSNHGMYEVSPEKAKTMLTKQIIVIVVLLIFSFIGVALFTPIGIVVCFASLFVIIGLQASMTKRSRLGVQLKNELEGLKLYLGMAEKDRLAALQSANAPLAENAHEPKRNVKLFEKLLPYAIVFGVEKTWAEAFKDLYTTPPDWYQGNWSTFNTAVFVSHLNSSVTAVNSSFTAPSSSGSSGFSGGGAGGGGGGGGGGGW